MVLVPILDLTKYQALSNDYLVLDLPADLDQVVPLLPRLCDRHRGVGSDGLLAFDPAEMTVRIFNPDGSEAEKSGNGLRIAACHAVLRHGAGRRFELRTPDGVHPVRVLSASGARVVVELDIGRQRAGGELVQAGPAQRVFAATVDLADLRDWTQLPVRKPPSPPPSLEAGR